MVQREPESYPYIEVRLDCTCGCMRRRAEARVGFAHVIGIRAKIVLLIATYAIDYKVSMLIIVLIYSFRKILEPHTGHTVSPEFHASSGVIIQRYW